MCIFTGPVESVTDTNIFARLAAGRQWLAYEMSYEFEGTAQTTADAFDPRKAATPGRFQTLEEDTEAGFAMVLPIPVVPGSGDGAVVFVDLSAHAGLFKTLGRMFQAATLGLRGARSFGAKGVEPPLVVHDVGSFEASYVPTLADFDRLDPRFKLEPSVWDAFPGYADFGFAVFKLKAGHVRVHPMAFHFPTRFTDTNFFPTVHIHDDTGEVHEVEEFDHTLYSQTNGDVTLGTGWDLSSGRAGTYFSEVDAQGQTVAGLIDPALPVVRRRMVGRLPNRDTLLAA